MSGGFSIDARSRAPELMDDHAVDYETFRGCLADLARVNAMTLAYRPTLAFLDRLRGERRLPEGRPLTILDVGSGYGDTLRVIARWARRRGVPVALTGLDGNPWSARAAAEATPADLAVSWVTSNVFESSERADVILSSLFTHHLDDRELARFLAWSEDAASVGWFVNDLRRSRFSHAGFALASRLLRMHPFVRHDGPVSIARAFVEADWRAALAGAGVPERDVEVRRWFPFRLCVSRVKPG
ncbi:methyltransferase domain-containing protein [Chelatococcus sambhunathii]|uniref:Methyltransferase domain-containing protein n=1 Tax=Chelatococcus sambhunathii TaxID=363953 RepID=A0ABU1DA90_9HYPH|nr:methyltransferase domain-containing protein [Chelatococcus sambhunathii]MDR4305025.1 methyltransferase domain-containing protein [Chelatococcus sambhunathii]